MNLRLNLGCGRLRGGRGGWTEGEEVKEKEATEERLCLQWGRGARTGTSQEEGQNTPHLVGGSRGELFLENLNQRQGLPQLDGLA